MRAAWIVLVVAAGCSSSNNLGSSDDLSAPGDLGPSPDAAGQFGAACDITNSNCFTGMHCATTQEGDVCIPDPPGNPIPEDGPCTPINFGGIIGDFCTPGTSCIDYLGTSLCRRGCFVHADCMNNEFCIAPTNSSAMKNVPGLGPTPLSGCVADDGCDPILQTGCPDGEACYFSGEDDIGRSRNCDPVVGSLPPDEPCESHRDCLPGETCSGLGFCRLLCFMQPLDTDGGTIGACPDSEGTCMAFFGSGDTYGLCE
jgi:hypothetical protein